MYITPTLLTDGYKIDHRRQLPEELTLIYNNFTPRKGRIAGVDRVAVVGIQGYNKETLVDYWNENFFNRPIEAITEEFSKEMEDYTLSKKVASDIGVDHWRALHKLGYLPLCVKALPEGLLCPYRVPVLTMSNTLPEFAWLPQFLETDMSSQIWGQITSATMGYEYFKMLTKWAKRTGADTSFVPFQGHDFSYRGMFGREAAALSGAGHLMSGFVGTDNLPAIPWLRRYYNATGLIGCSVPATEHAVMCIGTGVFIEKNNGSWEKYGEAEFEVFKRLITEVYPEGIVSIVSDTWNIWKVLTEYMPKLKDIITKRNGKVVIRPDSGDPVDIICGTDYSKHFGYVEIDPSKAAHKGVVELLWNVFGGQQNDTGYRQLDPHIGVIYGDSITLERAEAICDRLAQKKFTSTNCVFGIGSFTYNYVTRDTHGFAMKATYAGMSVDDGTSIQGIEVFKDPITDDGTKKSAKGLLQVYNNRPDTQGDELRYDGKDMITLVDQCTNAQEEGGLLKTVFLDGQVYNEVSLETIRKRLLSQIG